MVLFARARELSRPRTYRQHHRHGGHSNSCSGEQRLDPSRTLSNSIRRWHTYGPSVRSDRVAFSDVDPSISRRILGDAVRHDLDGISEDLCSASRSTGYLDKSRSWKSVSPIARFYGENLRSLGYRLALDRYLRPDLSSLVKELDTRRSSRHCNEAILGRRS